MGFSNKQVAALRRNVEERHIRTRQSNGRELSYLEGWYVISAANRIFGFDGWSRETLEVQMRALAREPRLLHGCVYGQGQAHRSGERDDRHPGGTWDGRRPRRIPWRGARHGTEGSRDDATKRALATFGRPFGLELYRGSQAGKQGQAATRQLRRAVPGNRGTSPATSRACQLARSQAALERQGSAEADVRADRPQGRRHSTRAHPLPCPCKLRLSLRQSPSTRATTRPRSRVLRPITAGSTITTFGKRTPR